MTGIGVTEGWTLDPGLIASVHTENLGNMISMGVTDDWTLDKVFIQLIYRDMIQSPSCNKETNTCTTEYNFYYKNAFISKAYNMDVVFKTCREYIEI